MNVLIVISDAPYGTEKAYNALRIANQLGKAHEQAEVKIFLLADAVFCAHANQSTPSGFYNIERMLKFSLTKGATVKICGTCGEARGVSEGHLLPGAEVGTLAELGEWVVAADKVLTF